MYLMGAVWPLASDEDLLSQEVKTGKAIHSNNPLHIKTWYPNKFEVTTYFGMIPSVHTNKTHKFFCRGCLI